MDGRSLLVALFACCLIGCSSSPTGTPPGAIVGRYNVYDYSPSVLQVGSVQQFWWCGQAHNPANPSQYTDTILYESIDASTHQIIGPEVVLAETPGAWDSEYTCNPHVVGGVFTNPLGNGQSYAYAMYYVGTRVGTNNSIGVAFSKDGVLWKKYPSPVIPSTYSYGYGAAQPVAWNPGQKQAITLFYEDDDPSGPPNHHFQASSTDGTHFTTQGVLTLNGIDPSNPNPGWGDMALDPVDNYWYATFNRTSRAPSTTGGTTEPGGWGVQLYRIPQGALLNGSAPWELITNFDTNSTGSEMIAGAGILHNPDGTLYDPGNGVNLYPAFSNPATVWNASPAAAGASGDPARWDVAALSWSASDTPLVDLNLYANKQTQIVTTGWTDPTGSFAAEQTLGKLYTGPQNGAVTPLYGCKSGNQNYFVSLDPGCEGQRILGVNGYLYSQPVAGLSLAAIYRCATATAHFASKNPQCDGATDEGLLGYVIP